MTDKPVRYREFDPYPYEDRNDSEKRYTYPQASKVTPPPLFKPREGYEDYPAFYEEEFPYEDRPAILKEEK